MRFLIISFLFTIVLSTKAQTFDLRFKSDNLISSTSGVNGMLVNGVNTLLFPWKQENFGFHLDYQYYSTSGHVSEFFSGYSFIAGTQYQKNIELDSTFTFFWQLQSGISYNIINRELSNILSSSQNAWGNENGAYIGIEYKAFDEFNDFTGYGFFISTGLTYHYAFRNQLKVNNEVVTEQHSLYEKFSFWSIPIIIGISVDL